MITPKDREHSRRLNNILSRGKLVKLTPGEAPVAQIELMANEVYDGIEFKQQFGFVSNPPVGAEVTAAFFGGHRDHGTVLNAFDKDTVPTDLESGESCLYNAFGASIKLRENGDIILRTGNTRLILHSNGSIEWIADTWIINGSSFPLGVP